MTPDDVVVDFVDLGSDEKVRIHLVEVERVEYLVECEDRRRDGH